MTSLAFRMSLVLEVWESGFYMKAYEKSTMWFHAYDFYATQWC